MLDDLSQHRSAESGARARCVGRRPTRRSRELIADFDNQFSFLGNEGTKFYFLTDLEAPTKRIVAMDIDQPGREHRHGNRARPQGNARQREHPERPHHLQYMVDVLTEVDLFDLTGKSLGKVELPGKGTVGGFGGDQDNKETFFVYTSYNVPTSVYRYDVLANKSELIRQPKVKFDPDNFAVEQVFYNSKDGTRVPMILAYSKGSRN